MTDYVCPCSDLNILFADEKPHQDAETCRNALYTTIKGGRSLLGYLRIVDTELAILQGERDDILKLEGAEKLWYSWRAQVLTRDFNFRHRISTLLTFEEWLAQAATATRLVAANRVEACAMRLGLSDFVATSLRGHA